jgi:hypothetical protein
MSSNQAVAPMEQGSLQANPLRTDIRLLFQSAMAVFVVTVAIGLLNGQHITVLSTDVLLTHVHSGTLGWITLGVFAVGLWLFSEGKAPTEKSPYVRTMSILGAIAVPVYVLAFLSGNAIARAIFGFPVLIAIIGIFGWVVARARSVRLGIPQLAILGALFTLIVGSTIGVLLQIQFVTLQQSKTSFLPNGAFAAHPATQVVGYLLLIGMAISEWRLMPNTGRLPIAGLIQIILPFFAGFVLTFATLLNIQPLLLLNALLEVIAVIIFIVRFAPRVVRISWVSRTGERFFALSAIFLVVNVAILLYLIVSILSGALTDFTAAPGVLIALDHSMFIGVMTNALFGLIQVATSERRSFWPWADHVLFWGMNVGLTGFLVTLILEQQGPEKIFTPIMGLSILLGLLTYAIRMRRPAEPEAVEVRVSPTPGG